MERKLFLALFLLVGLATNMASAKKSQLKRVRENTEELLSSVSDIKNQLDDLEGKLDTVDQRLNNLPATIGNIFQGGVNSILQAIDQECVVPPQLSDRLIREDDGYLLAFRLTSGIERSAYDKYLSVGNNDDANDILFNSVPCGCKTNNGSLYCDRHYRSELLDLWFKLPIDKVKLSLHWEGETKVTYVFNGEGSDFLNFFEQSRLEEDMYTDLSATNANPNFFSIAGDGTYHRRFFMNNNYGGCAADAGWLIVVDGQSKPCPWERYVEGFPFVMYAREPSPYATTGEPWMRATWQSQTYGIADVLTVSIKLKETTC